MNKKIEDNLDIICDYKCDCGYNNYHGKLNFADEVAIKSEELMCQKRFLSSSMSFMICVIIILGIIIIICKLKLND